MVNSITLALRALVAGSLLLASATVTFTLVTVKRAPAAGALAIGDCGAFGQAFDFPAFPQARARAMSKCGSQHCNVVAVVRRGCAAFAIDYKNACGGYGWGKAVKLGRAQNIALRGCYGHGGKECVIRTFFCDVKG